MKQKPHSQLEVLAMLNKKKSLVLVAASVLLLAGCSGGPAKALPTDIDNPIVDTGEVEIYNNELKVVVDRIREQGTYNGDVHNKLMEAIADAKYASSLNDPSFKALIDLRVNEKLLAEAKNSSYAKDGKFSEEKFAISLVKEMYKVNGTYDISTITEWYEDVIFTPDITKYNVGEKALHLDYYREYIDEVLVPEVLQQLLIEDYVIENEPRSLYLSKAREVNYIKIKTNDNHPEAAKYLIDTFITTNITGASATKESANLEILGNAWRGVSDQFIANEAELLAAANVTGDDFDHTILGDLNARYNLISDNINLTDSAAESEFTGNGAHLKELGLEKEINRTKKIDYTVDGWYIRDGGLTDLPNSIRTRLFDRNTEKGVDHVLDDKGVAIDGGYLDANKEERNSYIRNINGIYYLMPESYDEANDRNILHFDRATSTYYIVQINEAVSRNKFDENSDQYYGDEKLADVSREIASIIAKKDTIKTRAIEHYLESVEIDFHDEQIYEYYQKQYPDIFG